MTVTVIITICLLLLVAYVFNITASKTKIPSIILLLLLGFLLKKGTDFLNFQLPNLEPLLPILGTVGLILIVLEGSLELELNKSKLRLIKLSSVLALFPMLITASVLAYCLNYSFDIAFPIALINAIPLCIISSAIAIPSVKNLESSSKEFIIYESSLSDIFGVILFNFITINSSGIGVQSFIHFFIDLIVMFAVSIIATVTLAILIANIKHHIKFVPIILLVVLIYAVAKVFHLPALIFILLFGLALHNIDHFKNLKIIQRLDFEELKKEVHKFTEITTEFAFLVRALFFLLFGFLIQLDDITNLETLPWAIGITVFIFLLRFVFLKLFKLSLSPLLFVAPRGLITILLFLAIPLAQKVPIVNNALLIQVILLCATIMMLGLIFQNKLESIPKTTNEGS